MADYVGLYVEGIVKPEYRGFVYDLVYEKEWEELAYPTEKLKELCSDGRFIFVPSNPLSYMPDRWDEIEYTPTFNEITGLWKTLGSCATTLIYLDNPVEQYLYKVAPILYETATAEIHDEVTQTTHFYKIENNTVEKLTTHKEQG